MKLVKYQLVPSNIHDVTSPAAVVMSVDPPLSVVPVTSNITACAEITVIACPVTPLSNVVTVTAPPDLNTLPPATVGVASAALKVINVPLVPADINCLLSHFYIPSKINLLYLYFL